MAMSNPEEDWFSLVRRFAPPKGECGQRRITSSEQSADVEKAYTANWRIKENQQVTADSESSIRQTLSIRQTTGELESPRRIQIVPKSSVQKTATDKAKAHYAGNLRAAEIILADRAKYDKPDNRGVILWAEAFLKRIGRLPN
jgi:hypothetical protein